MTGALLRRPTALLAVLTLLSSGLVVGTVAQAAPDQIVPGAGEWSLAPSPNESDGQTTNFLSGLTCISEMDCWAVGYQTTGPIRQTLIQHWDGSSWQVVDSANAATTQDNVLKAVACASKDECWAVGSTNDGDTDTTFIQHWDGIAWSIEDSPNALATQANVLNDVTCVSASECWAVGNAWTGTRHRMLVLRWNGIAWSESIAPDIDPTATEKNQLSGVTCTSASNCWAVGFSQSDTAFSTLTVRWDGATWSRVASPDLGASNFLEDVFCLSSIDCWAVGYARVGSVFRTLIERWDGDAWVTVDSPNVSPTQSHFLHGVSCIEATECFAVGASANSSRTLALTWDGSNWSITQSPNSEAMPASYLYEVSCVTDVACVGVGHARSGTLYQTLMVRWDRTSWRIMASPNVGPTQPNFLNAVDCLSPTRCWAVGHSYTSQGGSVPETLIERWDGNEWIIVASPNLGTQHNFLHDVTCLSQSDCWAIGSYLANGIFRTLITHWDGSAWNVVPSPNADPNQSNRLHGISCTSSTDCWAVGFTQTGDGYRPQIQRWDGSSWQIVVSPSTTPTQDNLLFGVTCVTSSDCWAVGYEFTGSQYETLVQRWDGDSWDIVSSPNTSVIDPNFLRSVVCTASTDCWAAGHYVDGPLQRTLILRWDGESWTIADSPNTSDAEHNFIEDITCASESLCWVVGRHFTGVAEQTLIAGWDGESWAVVASPNGSSGRDNILSGVTCASVSDCWAVGFFHAGSAERTMALHYQAEETEPEPTPSDSESPTASPSPSDSESPTASPSPSDVGGSPSGSPSATPGPVTSDDPTPSPRTTPSTTEETSPSPTPEQTDAGRPPPRSSPTTSDSAERSTTGSTTATINVSRAVTAFRRPVVLSGTIEADDTCGDPTQVEIGRRVHGTDTFRKFRTVEARPAGDWITRVRARRSAAYVARAADARGCSDGWSVPVDVSVQAKVVVKRSSRCGALGLIRGRVRPKHPGTSVALQRRNRRKWVHVSSDLLDDRSRFVLTPRRCGRHRVVWRAQNEANLRAARRLRI